MNGTIRVLIKFILAYLCTIITGIVTGYGITRIDILLPLLCLLLYCIFDVIDTCVIRKAGDKEGILPLLKSIRHADLQREFRYSFPLAAFFSESVAVGRHIDVWNESISSASAVDIILWIVLTALFTFLIIFLFAYSDRSADDNAGHDAVAPTSPEGHDKISNAHDLRSFFIFAVILLLCWLPYYLTMFPGNLGKDTFESVDMVLGNIPWTNHHPIFFTSLIGIVLTLTGWMGSLTASLAVFTFLHMTVVAMTLSRIICFLKSKWRTVALVFFALHPIVAMYSIYITKDVLFACIMALLILHLMEYGKRGIGSIIIKNDNAKKKDRYYPVLSALLVLIMLLRNNGLMIVVVLAVIFCIIYRKDIKRLLPAFVIPVVFFLLYKGVAYGALGISSGSFAESASVPLQQVGYVICEHTDEEIDAVLGDEYSGILNDIMPYDSVRGAYTLGYTDTYKFDDDFDDEYFNDHKAEFMKIWLKLLPKYFGEYVDAYLAQTAGYWHYGETNTVATQGVWEENTLGVERIDLIKSVTGMSLYGIIEKLMLGMRKAPLLCILSSMAMQLYAVLLAVVSILRRRGIEKDLKKVCDGYVVRITALIPLLLLWLSIMIATPAFCLFRYTYPFFILWPVIIYLIATEGKEQ